MRSHLPRTMKTEGMTSCKMYFTRGHTSFLIPFPYDKISLTNATVQHVHDR
jgi:hypothetical protein